MEAGMGVAVGSKKGSSIGAEPSASGGVAVSRVIDAFGIDHGFPVKGGIVRWDAMQGRLEQLRQEALAAGK